MSQETNEPNQNLGNPQTEPQAPPITPEPAPTNQPQPINLLQNQAYIESERERIRLQQENETLRNQSQQNQHPDFTQANAEYFSKPAETISRMISEEVTRTISPIAQKFEQFTRGQSYLALKSNYRQIPNFNLIEANVDQIMANLEPTAANMNGAIQMAIGQLTLQGHQFITPVAPQVPNNPVTPPNLPPSPPPAPVLQSNNANKITLTELQKRVARENNMTDEQYISYLLADSKEVITMEKK